MHDNSVLDRPPFDINSITDEAPALHPPLRRRGRNDAIASLRRLAQDPNRDTDQSTPEHGEEVAESEEAGSTDAGEALLNTRQNTHGDFADNARVSQSLKRIFRAEPGWELLSDIERESMDMIALKFSRILSGKSMEKQHWEDVVGYGKLVERECNPSS